MTLLFYLLAGILLLILILAFLAPKNYNVSRSIEIRKPKSEVFEYLRVFKEPGKLVTLGEKGSQYG